MDQHSETSEQPHLSVEDRLLGVMYQFVKLHGYWSKDWSKNRKELTDQIQQLEKTIEALSGEVSSFSELESDIQEQIQGSVRNAGAQIVLTVREEIRSLMSQAIYGEVNRFAQVVREAESLLQHYRSQTRWQKWKVLGGSLVVSLGVGVLVSWLLMPHPIIPLTDDQYQALVEGLVYERVWPKLSPKAQTDWQKTADRIYKIKPVKR